MNLILIGPQGSGKSTQAELLAKKFKLSIITVGQLFRDEIRKQTVLGKKAEKFVLRGALVPDYLTKILLKKALKKKKYKSNLIFDGFPRNLKQTKFLEKLINIDYAIFINISQKEIIKRLARRRVCNFCGKTYHLLTKKPKRDLLCDKCSSKLIQRTDDYPKAIKKRLKIYNDQTLPLLNYFKKNNKLVKINGEQKINKVFKDLAIILKSKQIKK